jgi:N-methylhydantoinase A
VPFGDAAATVAEAFHSRHERRYGYAARDERVELATVRVTAAGPSGAPPSPAADPGAGEASAGRIGTRDAWDAGVFVTATVYERERLAAGARIEGPAIVQQYDTTTWLPRGWRATADPFGNLRLERS